MESPFTLCFTIMLLIGNIFRKKRRKCILKTKLYKSMGTDHLNVRAFVISFIFDFIRISLLVTDVFVIPSCNDNNENDIEKGTSCSTCGVADRLPEDIVSMAKIYLSVEFLDIDSDLDMAMGSWDSPANPESKWALTD